MTTVERLGQTWSVIRTDEVSEEDILTDRYRIHTKYGSIICGWYFPNEKCARLIIRPPKKPLPWR